MTKREFYAFVIANVDNKEVVEMAKSEVALLDKKNEKAKSKRMEVAKANEPIMATILTTLANGEMVASDIAKTCEISTPKAVAMCKKLVEVGKVAEKEISIPKIGKRKAYSLVVVE